MLRFLLGKAGDRKLRLFDLACARRVWQFLPEERRQVPHHVGEKLPDRRALIRRGFFECLIHRAPFP